MSSPPSSATDAGGVRIKSAASALLRGGTLVSEPCPKCGGVQVKLADKTSCINCGYESTPREEQKAAATASQQAEVAGLGASAAIVEAKIAELASDLKDEKDTAVQRQKVELLEAYLRILEKMIALSAR